MSAVWDQDRRAELLAAAHHDEIVPLAERLLGEGAIETPTVVRPPEEGMIMLQVREPVEESRFYLGEVLVTECTVAVAGAQGWCMRAGDDRVATLAAAVLDAVARADLPSGSEVDTLCTRIHERRAREDAAEWADVQSTTVVFEELA